MTTTKHCAAVMSTGTVTQANPIIIWPGATIDWAGRMAPFSQDTNLSLSGVGNRRRISGLTDSKDARLQGSEGSWPCLRVVLSFAGDLEVKRAA